MTLGYGDPAWDEWNAMARVGIGGEAPITLVKNYLRDFSSRFWTQYW